MENTEKKQPIVQMKNLCKYYEYYIIIKFNRFFEIIRK